MKIKILITSIVLIGFLPTSFVFAQLTPPANWPEWLKQEWENNIDDVRKTAEETGTWDFDNGDLPQLLQWATENKIKIIDADGGSLTAMPGTNQIWRAFKEIPPHLIKLLEDGTISLINKSCLLNAAYLGVEKDEGKIIKKTAIISMCRTARAPDVAHEFGHIVDLVGIRNEKGNEFSLGKTDEGIRVLREEYDRIFKTSAEYQRMYEDGAFTAPPPGFLTIYSVRAELENFGDHFSAYILGPYYFREKAAQESLLAEKYEFLKTKIFLGKEYDTASAKTTAAPSSIETTAKPSSDSGTKIKQLQEQITTLQAQIAKLQAELTELQKIEEIAKTEFKFTKTLYRGMKDAEVSQLQEFLKQYPEIYPEGLITGYFGSFTEKAVKKFQEKYGIESIGIVGPKTRQKLNELTFAKPEIKPEEKIVKPITPPMTTPSPISTPIPTPVPITISTPVSPPISTVEKKVISLVPPANWTDELKKEWNDNLEEVRRVAEGIQQWNWNWESLHNEDLPKLIQWGEEHSLIKLVYGGAFTSEKAPKVTIPGVNAVFQALSAMPSHLVKTLEGGAGGTLYLANRFENCGSQAGCYSSGAFYITICPSGTGDMHTTAHELGHIVDCVGIRNAKGNEFSFGKTDEEINDLRKEYERIFQPSLSPSSDYALKEAFAGWFSDYITPDYVQRFRKEATQDPRIAEKYEFLETKIFLGKEY